MQTNRGFIQLLGPILIIIAIGVGGYIYYQQNYHKPVTPAPTQPVACTAEAKICPDGSAVGRTGPNCEFAQCPNLTK